MQSKQSNNSQKDNEDINATKYIAMIRLADGVRVFFDKLTIKSAQPLGTLQNQQVAYRLLFNDGGMCDMVDVDNVLKTQ